MPDSTEHIVLATRTYFSGLHQQSAVHFVERARQTEEAGNPSFDSDIINLQIAQVTAAILTTVAYLEATINEVFVDADEHDGGCMRALPEADRSQLARFWRLGIPQTASYSIVEKYETALAVLRREPIDRSTATYANIIALAHLRNELVHFEPAWYTHVIGEQRQISAMDKLERQLRGKFELNPLVGAISPFFPQRALGYGCARWALLSAVQFADMFFGLVGVLPFYHLFRPPLSL